MAAGYPASGGTRDPGPTVPAVRAARVRSGRLSLPDVDSTRPGRGRRRTRARLCKQVRVDADMANADALSAAPPHIPAADRLEQAGLISLAGVAATLQLSIAISQSLLALAVVCWIALVVVRHERIEFPR